MDKKSEITEGENMISVEEFEKEWMSEEQVAVLLGIAVGTLRNRRYSKKPHPPFNPVLKRYPRSLLFKWLAEKTQ